MSTNETKTLVNKVFDGQMRTLLNIRDFRNDFISHSEYIQDSTKELIGIYDRGILFLEQNGNLDHKKEWEEVLNEVRVQANQMNHVLALSDDFMNEHKKDHDFLSEWKEFEQRKTWLKEASLKLENLGRKSLPDESIDEWNTRYVVWESRFEAQIEKHNKYIKLIYEFEEKYSHDDLMKITHILTKNSADEVDWNNPEVFQQQYIKAIQEFQREFKPRNLWDTIMEILAGGVHPSPSERMMLEQWADGEQKTREDM